MGTANRSILLAMFALAAFGATGEAVAGAHEDANAADRRGDYATELRILQPQAARGEAWAENNLGLLYEYGNGVPLNDEQALAWYQKAAAQRDPGGELNLGQMYEQGQVVDTDLSKAAALYRQAGQQGRPMGWSMLKRLCDSATKLGAVCAGIPAGTMNPPLFDLRGKSTIFRKLAFDLGGIAVCGVVLLSIAALILRRARRRPSAA